MEPTAECARVHELTRAFATGRSAASLERGALAHLESCRECRAAYEAAVSTAALLVRARRRERAAAVRRKRRETQRSLALSAGAAGGSGGRGYRLRILLLPALACALMVSLARVSSEPARAAEIERLAGAVEVAGAGVEGERALLGEGESCATSAGARARLRLPNARAELAERTALVLEDVAPARLWLAAGELEVEGACVLVTLAGVVAVDGRARVPARGEPSCLAGRVRVVDAAGVRDVLPDLRSPRD